MKTHRTHPDALNTAADFVEGLGLWAAGATNKAPLTYYARLRGIAQTLEAGANTADPATANGYNHAAKRIREAAADSNNTRDKAAIIAATKATADDLRAEAEKARAEAN